MKHKYKHLILSNKKQKAKRNSRNRRLRLSLQSPTASSSFKSSRSSLFTVANSPMSPQPDGESFSFTSCLHRTSIVSSFSPKAIDSPKKNFKTRWSFFNPSNFEENQKEEEGFKLEQGNRRNLDFLVFFKNDRKPEKFADLSNLSKFKGFGKLRKFKKFNSLWKSRKFYKSINNRSL